MNHCHVTKQLHDHLDMQDALEAAEEYAESIREQHVAMIIHKCSEMSYDEIESYLAHNYEFDLREYLEDNLNDDGNFEYFVKGRNDYYRKSMLNVCDTIDWTPVIERQVETDQKSNAGI